MKNNKLHEVTTATIQLTYQIEGLSKKIDEIDSMVKSIGKVPLDIHTLTDAYEDISDHFRSRDSTVQRLIDEKAYDTAKAYIDFLKNRDAAIKAQKPRATSRIVFSKGMPNTSRTVSSKGIANSKSTKLNNGANFGPDTAGTKTDGIQEAINAVAESKANKASVKKASESEVK